MAGRILFGAFALLLILPVARLLGDDELERVPSVEQRAGGDEMKRYFLIGPKEGAETPKGGFKLLLVMPGGNGGADFNTFVRRIALNALGDDYIVAQLVAPVWDPRQAEQLVWPTTGSPWRGMKFKTEEFVDAVVMDVGKSQTVDPKYVFTLSWSSGGPAAYAASLRKKSPVTGSFIAMSVFRPAGLPDLKFAKGHAYYLYQSPDDQICKLSFARTAREKLSEAMARVKLVEYAGGHGWHGDVFGAIRSGIEWLEKNAGRGPAKPRKHKSNSSTRPDDSRKKVESENGEQRSNLIRNGGFEHGMDGWIIANNSGRAEISVTQESPSRGKSCLHIKKEGGVPLDVVRLNVADLPRGGRVRVSAMVRSASADNSFFKFFIYDENEESLVEDVDVARIAGTGDWKKVSKVFRIPKKARSGAVMFVMVMGGEVWLDEVRVETVAQ